MRVRAIRPWSVSPRQCPLLVTTNFFRNGGIRSKCGKIGYRSKKNDFFSLQTMRYPSREISSTSQILMRQTYIPQRAVVVKRGKQSKNFLKGNPLVFEAAVMYTMERKDYNSEKVVGKGFEMEGSENSDISGKGKTKLESNIHQGALVAVIENPKESYFTDEIANAPFESGKRGRKSSRKFNYPHFILDSSTDKTTSVDSALQLNSLKISKSRIIGYGVYNPNSMYRVRILCHRTTCPPTTFQTIQNLLSHNNHHFQSQQEAMSLLLKNNLQRAFQTRLALGLPSSGTDSYRLVNGEGDGLSGLSVDILGGKVAVVMSSAAWCEHHKEIILEIIQHVSKQYYDGLELVWRNAVSRLKQDGYHLQGNEVPPPTTTIPTSKPKQKNNQMVIATESNMKYKTFPLSGGQKTGFYCDQRENRNRLADFCYGKRVLDLCCFNGGFSLHAARNGAKSCTGVDSSPDAIECAMENAALNQLEERIQFVNEDISIFIKKALLRGDTYDVIVLDPPKLAPSVSTLDRAARKYQSLNREAMKLIDEKNGGLFLTCSCSAAMTQKDGGQFFVHMVNLAADSAMRSVTLLSRSGAASCHVQCPALFPMESYLTAALFYVGPKDF